MDDVWELKLLRNKKFGIEDFYDAIIGTGLSKQLRHVPKGGPILHANRLDCVVQETPRWLLALFLLQQWKKSIARCSLKSQVPWMERRM
jgi:hypothetical protein